MKLHNTGLVRYETAGALALGWLLVLAASSKADLITTSLTQVNVDTRTGENIIYNDSTISESLNGISDYDLSATVSNSFTELSAQATVNVQIANFSDITERWESSEADAFAQSTMSVTGTVQGAPGSPGGTLVFTWAVVGDSTHQLNTSNTLFGDNQATVEEFYTSAKLTADVDGIERILLDDQWDFPGSAGAATVTSANQQYDVTIPAAADELTFTSNWEGNQPVDVSFILDVAAHLKMSDDNTRRFTAALDADFFSTATLQSVDVFNSGQFLPNARLVAPDGQPYPTSIPEPSQLAFFLGAMVVVLCGLGRQKLKGRLS